MGFDFENFGIGLLVGWGTAYGVYRARHLIRGAVDSVTQQATSAQNYATQTADRRYINDLVRLIEANHMAGKSLNLSDILVEPRFVPAPPLSAPVEEDDFQSVFQVVPVIPDHPYLLAPYNVETFSIQELSSGTRALAVLGNPGSGRTTALLAIALYALGQIQFTPPIDKVQQRLDAEEAALEEKQRAVRIKDRVVLEQRAKEQLAKEQGGSFDIDADGQAGGSSQFNRMMPVYIHLAELSARDGEFGAEVDPAEPLVRAVQRQLGRIASSTIPENLYKRLKRGQVLMLVDGYDDLPDSERSRQAAWLEALMSTYPDNFYIVTGPALGYGLLTRRLGLTPLFLRPWSDRDMEQAADKWADAWTKMGAKRRLKSARPAAEVIQRVKTNNRAISPLDMTLKIWANYADDSEVAGSEGWIRAYLTRHLPADQSLGLLLPQLTQAAVLQLEEGYITEVKLTAQISGLPVADEPSLDESTDGKKGKAPRKEETAQGKFIAMLYRAGLLIRYFGGRYQFRHIFLTHYLASLTLKDAPAEQFASKAAKPAWNAVLNYAVLHTAVDDVVRIRLNAPADMLYVGVLEMASWLPSAPSDAAWRTPLLRYIANLFLSPSQYPLVRERAAAALVATRDPSVLNVFRQAARSPNPHLRRLSCLGMGAFGDADSINDLMISLKDADENVQIAAALGLSAVGNETALMGLVEAFTEGSERLRQAIAETFADMPDEGYPVLYDAIQDEEMLLRRAAVFGLKRVKSTWAVISIYRAFLEDQQWYVRSAAQLAFQELQHGTDRAPRSYPPVEGITWLTDWAGRRGENVPPGEGANVVLLKALQNGEPNIRVFAASNLGQLGIASTTRALYGALHDKQAEVREAAHRALADLELQIGKPLPSPV